MFYPHEQIRLTKGTVTPVSVERTTVEGKERAILVYQDGDDGEGQFFQSREALDMNVDEFWQLMNKMRARQQKIIDATPLAIQNFMRREFPPISMGPQDMPALEQ